MINRFLSLDSPNTILRLPLVDFLVEFGNCMCTFRSRVLFLDVLEPYRLTNPQAAEFLPPAAIRLPVTPIFFTDSVTVLPRANPTSTSRSFEMTCSTDSCLPRDISAPLLVATTPAISFLRWSRLRGQVKTVTRYRKRCLRNKHVQRQRPPNTVVKPLISLHDV